MPSTEPNRAEPFLSVSAPGRPRVGADSGFVIRLERYEGPLDALLDLVKHQGLDIFELPIALITRQYLESLQRAESLDIELNAEFAHMAATLILIKSKALLPSAPSVAEEPEADPGAELVERLLERALFKQAAQVLEDRRIVEEHTWAVAEEALQEPAAEPPQMRVSVFDLVEAFGEVLQRVKERPVVDLPEDRVTVASRIHFLREILECRGEPIRLGELLERQITTDAVIATFLALLEMVKAGAARLRQGETYGEITLWRHTAFEEAFKGGDLLPAGGVGTGGGS